MYHIAKLIRKILMNLPLNWVFIFGRGVGLFLYYFDEKKRNTAYKNIKLAFPQKSNREVEFLVKESFINLSLGIIEGLVAVRLFPFIEVKGEEHIAHEGGIFVGIHEGSWELYTAKLAQRLNYAVFAKSQKNKNLDRFLKEVREESKTKVCFSLKELVRYLKNNGIIGLVVDHGAKNDFSLALFFSQLVPTPKGAIYLAKKFNKNIYPCFGYRKNWLYHTIEIGEPIKPEFTDETELLNLINKKYEKYLTQYPALYLWSYKRFKRKRTLNITILNDGKHGHLKQSQALLNLFYEEDYVIRSKIIDVQYKNLLTRWIMEIYAIFIRRNCLGCNKYFRFLIDKKTAEILEKTYADIVISTGSFTAPINRLFSSSLGAKSIVILRPHIPLNRFDLAIIPEHDRILSSNVVNIKGALTFPDNDTDKTSKCKEFFTLGEEKKISFFLGGILYDEKEFLINLELFIDKLKEFSVEKKYKILLSTSRRTSKLTEDLLEKKIKNFPGIEAVVFANRVNYDFVFEGFVSLSDIVFVSAESISMISEIVSFKKPCVCVSLERYHDKHSVFIQSIEKSGTFLKDPYNIKEINPKVFSFVEENRRVVKDAIRKLL